MLQLLELVAFYLCKFQLLFQLLSKVADKKCEIATTMHDGFICSTFTGM